MQQEMPKYLLINKCRACVFFKTQNRRIITNNSKILPKLISWSSHISE